MNPKFLPWLVLAILVTGCNSKTAEKETAPEAQPESQPEEFSFEPKVYEATGEQLLSMRLPTEEASEGWIRLFDGHTLFGWEIIGKANWQVENQSIVVDQGANCLLCTSLPWRDYELKLQFKATADTNSGIFLRTPLEPEDPAIDCYEVNIAPDDNPFPTGSVVKRMKTEEKTNEVTGEWRTMHIRLQGADLEVKVDDVVTAKYTDPHPLDARRIGLQHNSGRIEFKEIMLRPLGVESLLDKDLSKWKRYPEMEAEFTATDEGWMQVKGGPGQLETKDSFDDFVLLAEYKLPKDEINSGIFFRSIPGDKMMGYECQVSNELKDGSPLTPADCGAGGIFRRQDARVVAGETDKWATIVLVANQEKMGAWVNGVQVSDWFDDREPHENPRKGKRTDAGTIIIQGHDEGTEAAFKQFAITKVPRPATP